MSSTNPFQTLVSYILLKELFDYFDLVDIRDLDDAFHIYPATENPGNWLTLLPDCRRSEVRHLHIPTPPSCPAHRLCANAPLELAPLVSTDITRIPGYAAFTSSIVENWESIHVTNCKSATVCAFSAAS